jgi:hypothetical protein
VLALEEQMHPVLQKTFGGLSKSYYHRQLFFGMFFALIICLVQGGPPLYIYILLFINALLYPYARFVYEGIAGAIMGDTVVILSGPMLAIKFMMMAMCFVLAIFIAPIGLAYLYWHHSPRE